MKRSLTITLLVLTALLATAQPQVTWLERQYDLGVFKEQDGKVTCQMRLVNTGTEPLIIVRAQAGCGCTAITYPEDPIQPGDTAAVGLTYNPSGRPGQFTKQAIIFTNTVPNRTTVEIVGNVIPTPATLDKEYPVQAGSLRISQGNIPFGELVKGANKMQYLSAYNASTDTLLVQVSGARPHVLPAIVPDTVPPARVTALTVHYLSGHAPQWGFNNDSLTVTSTPLHQPSEGRAGTATVQVMAQVTEDFSKLTDKERKEAPVVSTDCGDRLDYGTLTAGETTTRSFTVTNKGKSLLAIRRVWAPEGEGITVNVNRNDVKRGKSATVTVTVDTAQIKGGMLNVPLTLMTNDPETPRMTIRLVGIIEK